MPASQIVDWEKQTAHLSHKKIGELAGIGFIGRNNLLVNPEIGSRFRLATILTNMPLEPDKKLKEGRNYMMWGILALFILVSYMAIIGIVAGELDFNAPTPGGALLP